MEADGTSFFAGFKKKLLSLKKFFFNLINFDYYSA